MKKFWRRLFSDQRGNVAVLAALLMVGLLGCAALVTDFGMFVLARQRLINAVDAAALAGAARLAPGEGGSAAAAAGFPSPGPVYLAAAVPGFSLRPRAQLAAAAAVPGGGEEEAAISTAEEYALKNGADPAGLNVYISTEPSGAKVVHVSAEKRVDFLLARLLGYSHGKVQASASAAVAGITACRGIAPLLVPKQDFQFGARYTLKYGDPVYPGNFGALALGGRGANVYRHNLIYGYGGKVSVGDLVMTEPGNMSGPTQGIDERLARCRRNCTVDNFEPGCPKILIIPVYIPDGSLHGRDEVKVAGFAAFLVDRADSERDEIHGYFISTTVPGGEADLTQPPGYGLYAVKLLE